MALPPTMPPLPQSIKKQFTDAMIRPDLGSSQTFYPSNPHEEQKIKRENEVLRQFDLIEIILKKVKKLEAYAKKNKLKEIDVIESFLTEEEFEVFNNRKQIAKEAQRIEKTNQEKEKIEKEIAKKYLKKVDPKKNEKKYFDFQKQFNPDITDDFKRTLEGHHWYKTDVGQKEFINKNYDKNALHLVTN